MSEAPTATPLSRVLDSCAGSLSHEAAQGIAHLQVDATFQDRLDELADKANEGQLTDDERQEYEQYVEALDLIAILQAKARKVLSLRSS